MHKYNFVDLFAGCGGLALGMERAGLESILLNEIDKSSCNTLRYNRPGWNVVESDISQVDFTKIIQEIDVLTGGFPLQAFSIAGQSSSINKTAGTLFFQMARAIKELQPKIFMAENVQGLLRHNKGDTLKVIKDSIDEIGYDLVKPVILDAEFYRVPQRRKRLIFIGIRKDLAKNVKFYWPSPHKRVMQIKDVFYKGELFNSDVSTSIGTSYPEHMCEILNNIPQGFSYRELPDDLKRTHRHLMLGKRLSFSEPCTSLGANPRSIRYCHPLEVRPLQTREFARIQTFPDNWEFKGSKNSVYKQISSAFPVNMAEALGCSVIDLLNDITNVSGKELCINKLSTLDKYIFDCLRMLASKNANFVKDKILHENVINENLEHCLTRNKVKCFSEKKGNGRCDLMLSGELDYESISAVIECKKILSNDTINEFGNKLSSACEQVDAYGKINPGSAKYIILYIFDKELDEVHEAFTKLKLGIKTSSIMKIDTTDLFGDMYSFDDKKIILCELKVIAPTKSFKEKPLTLSIKKALSSNLPHTI